jgi:saccharopine dehydrogenase-like NADP-dependent oxidoreductase
MRVVLMGAGHIGQTIAAWLSRSGDYQVKVVDCSVVALKALAHLPVQTALIDTSDVTELHDSMVGFDAVVNALPYHLALTVATQAKAAGCHYFDLTEDMAATREIMALAEGANTAFMPQCGLAPGFIGIVAHHLSRKFTDLHEIKMRVGALPAFPTNSLKYNLTWSVDGLINEYCHPCEAIRDGHVIEALPLEGMEHFSLDGTEYEAFNTSGGLGTLCDTLKGKVQALDYKTVRYPGHGAIMKMLLQELGMQHDQENLKAILRKSVPLTMQDVVLVFVTVSGECEGKFMQEVFARKIFADRSETNPMSAIQITTAAGICGAIDLFREKKLPQSGFIKQEQVSLPDLLANRFGNAYQQSRQVESIG